jgi:phosphohistidine phosphatase
MKLYLIQHGEATSEQENPSRPLTGKGAEDVKKTASFLAKIGPGPISIRHSGKLRARQTAQILADSLGPDCELREAENLSPNDPVKDLADELKQITMDLMIVGHLPFLGKLASALLSGSESKNPVAFRQGGVVCLLRTEEQTWQVAWMIVPEILK